MKPSHFWNSPLQQQMQRTQAQLQRNLHGGWWTAQKAKMGELLGKTSLTRRARWAGRSPLSLAGLKLEGTQSKGILSSRIRNFATTKPLAKIRRLWVDHNVSLAGKMGMQIHTDFQIVGSLRRRGTVSAHFYFANSVPLKDFNGRYCTSKGGCTSQDRLLHSASLLSTLILSSLCPISSRTWDRGITA